MKSFRPERYGASLDAGASSVSGQASQRVAGPQSLSGRAASKLKGYQGWNEASSRRPVHQQRFKPTTLCGLDHDGLTHLRTAACHFS